MRDVSPLAQPLLATGVVRHERLKPRPHQFSYDTFFLLLPMRSLAKGNTLDFPINRRAWMSFYDADHGDGRGPAQGGSLAWLQELLEQEGIHDVDGEIWLQCYPRVGGYAFKPVSFWYCHQSDQQLRAIVVEVNNTFGERHCYVLDRPQWGKEQSTNKVFHVSPFCRVQGRYRFRFMRTSSRIVARIEHDDDQGPLLKTSVSGTLVPATLSERRHLLWRYPLASMALMLHIHWQALRLWLKHIPFFSKPAPPQEFVTR
jgi:uncharacterized protein